MDERDRRRIERKMEKVFWKCAPYLVMAGGYLLWNGAKLLISGRSKNDRNGMSLVEVGHGWTKEQYICGDKPATSFDTPEASRIATEMIIDLNGVKVTGPVTPIISRATFEDGKQHDVLVGVIRKDRDGTYNGHKNLSEWLACALNGRFLSGDFRGRAYEDPDGDGFVVDHH